MDMMRGSSLGDRRVQLIILTCSSRASRSQGQKFQGEKAPMPVECMHAPPFSSSDYWWCFGGGRLCFCRVSVSVVMMMIGCDVMGFG